MKVIQVENLIKKYADLTAVDDISFSVEEGSFFSFLGVNGAGKSTTINIICTILAKDSGKVIINGHDLDKDVSSVKNDIGIVFQNSVLDNLLTVKENLVLRASLYGLRGDRLKSQLDYLIDMVELEEILTRPYGKLSGGQRRRVDIARALINQPKVLFLDEPTTGLDPQTRGKVWFMIDAMRKQNGATIFLTTHYMEETATANNVAIIDKGKIVAEGSPNTLKEKYTSNLLRVMTSERNESFEKLLADEKCKYTYGTTGYNISMKDSFFALDFAQQNKRFIPDFEIIKGDMDNVFLEVTGRKLRED